MTARAIPVGLHIRASGARKNHRTTCVGHTTEGYKPRIVGSEQENPLLAMPKLLSWAQWRWPLCTVGIATKSYDFMSMRRSPGQIKAEEAA